jgi:hypothetical protein
MTSLTIHMGTVVVPDSQTLQQRIDAAGAGSTLDLRTWSYTAGATVNKALTILGGTVVSSSNATALTVTASNVTIDGMSITGPQHELYVSHVWEIGVYVGTSISNLTVRNCIISNLGSAGMWLDRVTTLQLDHNTISDIRYAGIMCLSTTGGTVEYNTVSRIGEAYYAENLQSDIWDNAYGIALSTGGSPSIQCSSVIVQHNAVTDVPSWDALDTHGAVDSSFLNNTVSGTVHRGIFVTTSSASGTRVTVDGNTINATTAAPRCPWEGGSYDLMGVAMYGSTDCVVTGNELHSSWPDWGFYVPAGDDRVWTGGGNTGLTVSGNTLI